MASLESLPPDQRAVLELVLHRGRSYDEIAELLSIDRAGVRARALGALDALGPQTGVSAERRGLITDYLLGALPSAVAGEVRNHLASSPSERAWARVVAGELQPLATSPLPEIPVEAPAGGQDLEAERAAAATRAAAPSQESPPPAAPRRSSRLGGALLLGGGVAVVIAVVLVLVLSGGGSNKHTPSASRQGTTTTGTTTTGTTTTGTSTSATKVLSQINLKSPSGRSTPIGIAEVLEEQGKIGIAIVAQGLTPNSTKAPVNAYAVWLYNSPSDSDLLGFVNPGVKKNGRLQTAGGLPTNASHFHELLVTLETKSKPKTPGATVLEGVLKGV